MEKIIEKIVTEKMGLPFIFDDWRTVDRAIGKTALPCCVCIMPVSGVLSVRNGRYTDRPNMYVAFLDKVARDADGAENREVYERMKAHMTQFIAEINASKELDDIDGEVAYDIIAEGMSDILTGVGFSLSVRTAIPKCL